MTSINTPLIFSSIIPTTRQPKQLGDYQYIDISYNNLYDISNNIIYDIPSNIKFYKLPYYKLFLIDCINNVPIIIDKDNYVYLFLLDLEFNNIPICKIGYTSDILNRTISLKTHTNINMLLLAVISVKGQFQEKNLHTYLKIKCPYCIMNYKYPDGSNATELYKIHPVLIKELYYYLKHLELINKNNLLIIQEETKQIEYIEKTKQEQEKTKQIEEQEKTKQIKEQEKTKQIEEQEKTKQEQEKTKQEQEKTKQLELQLKILKLQNKK
jgi:hypothetical protein